MSKQYAVSKWIMFVVLIGLGLIVFFKFSMGTSHVAADNTLNNVRDRNSKELTPINQSNDLNDIAITQDIRKMLMDDKSLSLNAKNIKVITRRRIATLRGPIESMKEKAAIERIALIVAGPGKVDSKLEVKTK